MYARMIMKEDKSPYRRMEMPKKDADEYSTKTLQGNWFEQRLKYVRDEQKRESIYNTEFVPKTLAKSDDPLEDSLPSVKEEVRDPIVHPKIGYDEHPNLFENFTSISDLSYNHFPKWIRENDSGKSHDKKSVPLKEYLDPFHNLTKFGLVEQKKQEWLEEKNPNNWKLTMYNQSYPTPPIDCYEYPRWGRARCFSNLLCKSCMALEALRLRGLPPAYVSVPFPENPTWFIKKKTCDVITWECPKEEQKICVPKHKWKDCFHKQKRLY